MMGAGLRRQRRPKIIFK